MEDKKEIKLSSEILIAVYQKLISDIDFQINYYGKNISNHPESEREHILEKINQLNQQVINIRTLFTSFLDEATANEKYNVYEDVDYHYDLKSQYITYGPLHLAHKFINEKISSGEFSRIDDVINHFDKLKQSDVCLNQNCLYRADYTNERGFLEPHQISFICGNVLDIQDDIEELSWKEVYDIEMKIASLFDKSKNIKANIFANELKIKICDIIDREVRCIENSENEINKEE